MTKTVAFYFDPISPYSWLAAGQSDRVEAAGVRLDFRPMLLAGLLAAHGTKGPAETAATRSYTMRDVLRLAEMCNVVKQTDGGDEGGFVAAQVFRFSGFASDEGSPGERTAPIKTWSSPPTGVHSRSTCARTPMRPSGPSSACWPRCASRPENLAAR